MIPHIGIELEYMIVDRDTLDVKPIADKLLAAQAGEITGEVQVGDFCWSNELVLHVVEIKTNGPVSTLVGVAEGFQKQIRRINELLAQWNAQLLPTSMHPWMDPARETRIWPHDNAEVYAAFDRVFGCEGHGWSNLQSMHLNFPFRDDEEFGRLHAAIRLIMPILPALAASSPIMDGRITGRLDNRLDVYRTNCAGIASVTGDVIPEAVFDISNYKSQILNRIYRDLAPHDPEGILQNEWANARGAIARFDRNTIELRVLDVQECPAADIAIAAIVWSGIEALMEERWCTLDQQQAFSTEQLSTIFANALSEAPLTWSRISDDEYRRALDPDGKPLDAPVEIWQRLSRRMMSDAFDKLKRRNTDPIERLLIEPPLARRMLSQLGSEPGLAEIAGLYRTLAVNLPANIQLT